MDEDHGGDAEGFMMGVAVGYVIQLGCGVTVHHLLSHRHATLDVNSACLGCCTLSPGIEMTDQSQPPQQIPSY